jgi:membrane protein YdbS with pleckstrin-like domain
MTDIDTDPSPESPAEQLPALSPVADDSWQPLPRRGAVLAGVGGAMALMFPFGFASFFLARVSDFVSPWLVASTAVLLAATVGAWLAVKRHRRTYWKLDDEGFGLRRGNWWQVEVRVPLSRVQHLDLKRGPLERSLNLSTLVVHTAGTKLAAVSASGLDAADAERLRDRLAHQLDRDDAL